MAECGIKEFDELPAVIEGQDVDAMRAALSNIKDKTDKLYEQSEILYVKLKSCRRIWLLTNRKRKKR